jgi:hypothetical protein
MRACLALLLLALAAAAAPPHVPEYMRLRSLRDKVQSRIQQLQQEEEFARKPEEEKMLIAFSNGEKQLGKTVLNGELVVKTCLKWADVQLEKPTEAGKRVLALLPEALAKRYAQVIEVPKDRQAVAKVLLDGLDSEFTPVRYASIQAIMRLYRKTDPMMYEASMNKKQRDEPIAKWRKFVTKTKP